MNKMYTNLSLKNLNISEPNCEDQDTIPRWAEIGLIVYMITTALLAIFGNGLIVLVEVKNLCKTSTDWLVFYMAANDILFALVNVPIYVMFYIGLWKYTGSDAGCIMHVVVEKTTIFSSTLLLCTVALDRYFKTCRPHTSFLTPERAFRACVAITMVSVLLASPAFPAMKFDENRFCVQRDNIESIIIIHILHVLVAVTFVGMFIIVGYCYVRVAYTIKRRLVRNQRPTISNPVASCSTSIKKTLASGSGKPLRRNKIAPSAEGMATNAVPSDFQPAFCKGDGSEYDSSSVCGIENRGPPDVENKNSTKRPFETIRSKQEISKSANVSAPERVNIYVLTEKRAENARTDKTTKIMFAVTLVFLFSWIPTWLIYVYGSTEDKGNTTIGNILILFGRKLFMINTFMNPIFLYFHEFCI